MSSQVGRQHVAGTLALAGASLGVIAGVVQATAGASIPSYSGAKSSPVALGLLTVLLSGLSLNAAAMLRRPAALAPEGRVAAMVGLLVPALVCFSTVGALWYVPGVLLLAAAYTGVTADEPGRMLTVISGAWLRTLVSTLGALEVLMAVSAGSPTVIAVGVAGGVALGYAPWCARVRTRALLTLLGTVPFALLTWWSLVTPLLALLGFVLVLKTLRPQVHGILQPSPA